MGKRCCPLRGAGIRPGVENGKYHCVAMQAQQAGYLGIVAILAASYNHIPPTHPHPTIQDFKAATQPASTYMQQCST
jgi:hypothetical protein